MPRVLRGNTTPPRSVPKTDTRAIGSSVVEQSGDDVTFYGDYFMPTHVVVAVRQKFPKFSENKTDAMIRKWLNDGIGDAHQAHEWVMARKDGEYTCPLMTDEEGILYPIIAPSRHAGFDWAIVTVVKERHKESWAEYPPELPNPRCIIQYKDHEGKTQFIEIKEQSLGDAILDIARMGVAKEDIHVMKEVPYELEARTKR